MAKLCVWLPVCRIMLKYVKKIILGFTLVFRTTLTYSVKIEAIVAFIQPFLISSFLRQLERYKVCSSYIWGGLPEAIRTAVESVGGTGSHSEYLASNWEQGVG